MPKGNTLDILFVWTALAVITGASVASIRRESLNVSMILEILGVALLALLSAAVTLNSRYIAAILREIFGLMKMLPHTGERDEWNRARNVLLGQIILILLLFASTIFLRREHENIAVEEVGELNATLWQNATVQMVNASLIQETQPLAARPGVVEDLLVLLAVLLIIIPVIAITAAMLKFKDEGKEYSRAEPSAEVREATVAALTRLKAGEELRAVICSLYEEFCRILGRRGLAVTRYMTAREIMTAARRLFPRLPENALLTLTCIFEKARYSDHVMTVEDKLAAEEALTEISHVLLLE